MQGEVLHPSSSPCSPSRSPGARRRQRLPRPVPWGAPGAAQPCCGSATAAKGRSRGWLPAAAGFVCAACRLLQPQHSSSAAALAGWPAQQALSTAQRGPMADFTSAALLSDSSREYLGHGGCAVQQAAVYEYSHLQSLE